MVQMKITIDEWQFNTRSIQANDYHDFPSSCNLFLRDVTLRPTTHCDKLSRKRWRMFSIVPSGEMASMKIEPRILRDSLELPQAPYFQRGKSEKSLGMGSRLPVQLRLIFIDIDHSS